MTYISNVASLCEQNWHNLIRSSYHDWSADIVCHLRVKGVTGLQELVNSTDNWADITGLGKLVGSMCAVSGVLVLSLPIPIIAGNFEAFHKNQQKMTKAEKGKKKLKAAKIAEFERRQLYCNNKMTSCPSTKSSLSDLSVHFIFNFI